MRIIIILILTILISCRNTDYGEVEIIELDISKSTIPEGIAVNPANGEIFLSSVHEDRITKSSRHGKLSETLLERKDNGYSLGVGIDLWQDKLYALGKQNRGYQSILSIIDLKSKRTKTIKSNSVDTTYFNDLAIDKKGSCYMTDTDNHNIYFYDNNTGEIDFFLNTEMIRYPNGIAISEDGTRLYVDSWTSGIKIVELTTKKILNQDHVPTTKVGIDGLKYHKDYLYYIVNGGSQKQTHGLYRVRIMNNATDLGEPEPLLVNHKNMHLPTTLSIVGNDIYILANSQLDRLNQDEHKIINQDSLTNTYILKYKITEGI